MSGYCDDCGWTACICGTLPHSEEEALRLVRNEFPLMSDYAAGPLSGFVLEIQSALVELAEHRTGDQAAAAAIDIDWILHQYAKYKGHPSSAELSDLCDALDEALAQQIAAGGADVREASGGVGPTGACTPADRLDPPAAQIPGKSAADPESG